MILIKQALLNHQQVDILIVDNRFARIEAHIDAPEAEVIDATNMAILPPFYNAHTHAAMNLLRGYSDDKELFDWLQNYIWPAEARLTPEDIYVGSRLAILEMIKSGSVFFADMYWEVTETLRAAQEMGVRAAIGITVMDRLGETGCQAAFDLIHTYKPTDRIQLVLAPHAIYTVSTALLQRCAQEARAAGVRIHLHLSETEQEVKECLTQHGCSPVEYLHRIGILGSDCIVAHGVHVSEADAKLLAENGVTVVHCPVSNMKLGSGMFDLVRLKKAGCNIALGTDGAASNNNTDMGEEMKVASLLAKIQHSPTAVPAAEMLHIATRAGALAFGIDGGEIAVGRLADALLVSLDDERMVPNYHLISNWVYSADRKAIDTVLCNGKVVMRHGHVPHEQEIIAAARQHARKFEEVR